MNQPILILAAGLLAMTASSANAFDEADVNRYLATDKTFACSVENYGVLDSQDDQSPKARVYIQTGGIGVIMLVDLMVDNAGARYRFGSKIDVVSNIAEFEVNGSPREKTGDLSSGSDWPFLRGEFALSPGYPGSLHGVLKNSGGDTLELYCTED